MKKTIFIITAILFVLASCTPNKKTAIERILAGDYSAYNDLDSCNCTVLTKIENKYRDVKDSLYTGRCFTFYNNTKQVMSEKQIYRGNLHGYVYYFSQTGDTLTKNLYQYGKLIPNASDNFQCNCDSLKNVKNIKILNKIPFTGTCFSYYQGTNTKYMEKHYKDGLLDGYYVVYDQQGNAILSTLYSKGKVIN